MTRGLGRLPVFCLSGAPQKLRWLGDSSCALPGMQGMLLAMAPQQHQQQPLSAGLGEAPYIHSPAATSEPPVRNMSVSTASTTGSIEVPLQRLASSAAEQPVEPGHGASSTFMGTQVGQLPAATPCCCQCLCPKRAPSQRSTD